MARTPYAEGYADQLRNAIEDITGRQVARIEAAQHGNTRWSFSKLLIACVLMSWHEGQTLTSRFEHVREILAAMFPGWVSPASYTGYATALARSVGAMIEVLRPVLQYRVCSLAGRNWKIAGWIVFAVDGSRFESPRTLANEAGLGCAGKRKTSPQVFHTTLLHLGTNAIWDFRCGRGTESERRHLEQMMVGLPPDSLITADAGLIGYELCRRLQQHNVSFLLRVAGNITLLAEQMQARVQREGERVWLWPQGQMHSPPCVLRLLRLKQSGEVIYLVTNVLDPQQLTQAQAEEIYRRRWGIEVKYRSVKQTLNRAKWLSRTPATVLGEHQGTLLGFWILQLISLEMLRQCKRDVRKWSPARSRDAVRRAMRHALRPAHPGDLSWRDALGNAVQDTYVRHSSKRARDWPHKKHDPPLTPPRLRPLTPQQRHAGLTLLKTT